MSFNTIRNWRFNDGQIPQFSLVSMAIFTALVAAFVVVRMWSVPVATLLIPIIVGASTAYVCTQDFRALPIGAMSAFFWSALFVFFMFGFVQQYLPSQFYQFTIAEGLLVLLSVAAGYLGAVVHRH